MAEAQPLIPAAIRRHAASYLADELDLAMGAYTTCVARRDTALPIGPVAATLYTFPLGWRIAHTIVTEHVDAQTLDDWTAACAEHGIDLVLWIWDGVGLQPIVTWAVVRRGSAYLISPRLDRVRLLRARLRGSPQHARDRRGALEHAVDTTMRTAFVRCLELWGTIDLPRFERALLGTPGLKRAFASLLDEARCGRSSSDAAVLVETGDGSYRPVQPDAILPDVPRLPAGGVTAVRARAGADTGPHRAPGAHLSLVPRPEAGTTPTIHDAAWIGSTAVRYRGQRFATRLAARWAVFFDALSVTWSYHGNSSDHAHTLTSNSPMIEPEFWLPEHGCLLVVRHLLPAWEEVEQVSSLAAQTGVPVAVLHGTPGIEATGRLWLPGPTATACPNARWVACSHCGSLAMMAALSPTTLIIRCGNAACRARRPPLATEMDLRSSPLLDATAAAQTATFAAWSSVDEATGQVG